MARDRGARLELLRYQVGELEALGLAEGEADALIAERNRLANRGRLAEAAQTALALAWDADGADAHALAARAATQLRGAAALDPRLAEALQAIEQSLIGLREASALLAGYLETLDADPARQDQVERRVAAIEDLARKHHVTAAALPQNRGASGTTAFARAVGIVLGGLDERLTALGCVLRRRGNRRRTRAAPPHSDSRPRSRA